MLLTVSKLAEGNIRKYLTVLNGTQVGFRPWGLIDGITPLQQQWIISTNRFTNFVTITSLSNTLPQGIIEVCGFCNLGSLECEGGLFPDVRSQSTLRVNYSSNTVQLDFPFTPCVQGQPFQDVFFCIQGSLIKPFAWKFINGSYNIVYLHSLPTDDLIHIADPNLPTPGQFDAQWQTEEI
ncbi:MAG: hypothetical protein Hyperionvirus3_178 [Hyperionvirus sp.]|uniref:Uncharacterized protein n=1 Tax=Hyperionvirus sp. TaxID=2487770 RepID=A0A3G5A7L2_9VIRU|nr:MAG: hypothetical protein Hyperionvirus3_178 [Hyperionvirus sp.]